MREDSRIELKSNRRRRKPVDRTAFNAGIASTSIFMGRRRTSSRGSQLLGGYRSVTGDHHEKRKNLSFEVIRYYDDVVDDEKKKKKQEKQETKSSSSSSSLPKRERALPEGVSNLPYSDGNRMLLFDRLKKSTNEGRIYMFLNLIYARHVVSSFIEPEEARSEESEEEFGCCFAVFDSHAVAESALLYYNEKCHPSGEVPHVTWVPFTMNPPAGTASATALGHMQGRQQERSSKPIPMGLNNWPHTDGNRMLRVDNLESWVDESDLYWLVPFDIRGEIASCMIVYKDKEATCHFEGYGFLQFNSHPAAESLLKRNGEAIHNTMMTFSLRWVPLAQPTCQNISPPVSWKPLPDNYENMPHSPREGNKMLRMDGLEQWVRSCHVGSFFCRCNLAQARDVVSCYIPRDMKTWKSAGYGFVEFRSNELAEKILRTCNLVPIPGTKMVFQLSWAPFIPGKCKAEELDLKLKVLDLLQFPFYQPGEDSCSPKKNEIADMIPYPSESKLILLSGVNADVTEVFMRQFFQQFKNLTCIEYSAAKGCGFAEFGSSEAATVAMRTLLESPFFCHVGWLMFGWRLQKNEAVQPKASRNV